MLGDIRDPLSVHEAMKGCEIVFHLAALIAIPYSYRAPHINTNIHGTLNVVQAARELSIEKLCIHQRRKHMEARSLFLLRRNIHSWPVSLRSK